MSLKVALPDLDAHLVEALLYGWATVELEGVEYRVACFYACGCVELAPMP